MTPSKLLKILLVEDSESDMALLKENIRLCNVDDLHLNFAGSLHEAIDHFQGNHVDAMLLDLTLPDSSGLETVRRIHQHDPDIPIVVLTGLKDENMGVEALRLGAQDYLVKGSVDGRLIVRAIRYAIERKRAEEALRKSEERHRLLAQTMLQGVVHQSADGTIIAMNPAAERILGKTPAEFLGGSSVKEEHHTVREDGSPFPGMEHPAMTALRSGQPVHGVVMGLFNPRRNERRWIRIDAMPIFKLGEPQPVEVYTVFEDITDRRKDEEALRELNATLENRVAQRTQELEHRAWQLQKLTLELTEAEERERKRLAGIIHDDLQQVLVAATFFLELLNKQVASHAESLKAAGQIRNLLIEAIDKAHNLSHELTSPYLSQGDLVGAFEWLAQQMQKNHGLTVHVDIGARIEVNSEPRRFLLYRTAQELLFNVIKHAGVREVILRLRRGRACIRLTVSDRGSGFNPADPDLTPGLGLLSIRERVEYLGGRLKIKSVPGKGSTFIIAVPDAESSPQASQQLGL